MDEAHISIIRSYFFSGYPYRTIHGLLFMCHNIDISMRSLKRILKKESLKRRPVVTNALLRQVLAAILIELRCSGCLLGYRAMWHRLRLKYNIVVPRDIVMMLLKVADPVESVQRKYHRLKRRVYRSKGPNFCWHIDGYDKLKPFGFAIHGCIDGFSRKILWLHVGTSNNDPKIIGHHYLQWVKEVHGCPKIVRCDKGTENSVISYLQPFLRRNSNDVFSGENSFRYGRSKSNQRIEAWWSVLRKWTSDWWIDFFKNLKDCGAFDETDLQIELVRFSFMSLIQTELDCLVNEWNTHRMRNNKSGDVMSGIPNELYYLGNLNTGVQNHLVCDVSKLDLDFCDRYVTPQSAPASLQTLNRISDFMDTRNLRMPDNVEAALDLYLSLINYFHA